MRLRSLLTVSVLSIVAAICMRSWGGQLPWQLWLPTGLLIAAAALAHHRHVGSQLLTRAILWSNLILGGVILAAGSSREQPVAALMALATGLALVFLGRQGLESNQRGGTFVPVAYRATLVAIMVLALADAQTLLLVGSLYVVTDVPMVDPGALALALGVALLVGIVGLYRLRVWGLAAGGLACLGLLGASLSGSLELPAIWSAVLAGSAALQVLLAVRLFVALWKAQVA